MVEIATSCLSVLFDGKRVRLRIVGNFNTDFGPNDWAELYERRTTYGPRDSVRRARALHNALTKALRNLDLGPGAATAARAVRRG